MRNTKPKLRPFRSKNGQTVNVLTPKAVEEIKRIAAACGVVVHEFTVKQIVDGKVQTTEYRESVIK